MFAGALAVPESARWLALRGRPDEAVASLQQTQGLTPESAAAAVAKMQPAGAAPDVLGGVAKLFEVRGRAARAGAPRAREQALTASRAWARVQEGGNRRALTVGVGLVLPPPPPPRTKRTRLVPTPVLTGHAASPLQVLLQQLSGQVCPPPALSLAPLATAAARAAPTACTAARGVTRGGARSPRCFTTPTASSSAPGSGGPAPAPQRAAAAATEAGAVRRVSAAGTRRRSGWGSSSSP